MWKKFGDQLLTKDYRYFDLLHPVMKTKLPREEFYKWFIWALDEAEPGVRKVLRLDRMLDKPDFWWKILKSMPRFMYRKWRYQRVHLDPQSFVRSEIGVIGPDNEKLRDDAQFAPKGTIELSAQAKDVIVPTPRLSRNKLPVADAAIASAAAAQDDNANANAHTRDEA